MKELILKINRNDMAFVCLEWVRTDYPCRTLTFAKANTDKQFVGVLVTLENFETYAMLVALSKKMKYEAFDAVTKQPWEVPATYKTPEA